MKKKTIVIAFVSVVLYAAFCLRGTDRSFTSADSVISKNILSYPDEPDKGVNIVSATTWTLPKNPEVIKADTQESAVGTASAEEIWKNSPLPDLKQTMDQLHIGKQYYEYLYRHTYFPEQAGKMKLTGDGKYYTYIQSTCGKDFWVADAQYTTLFIGNNAYTFQTRYGSITPRADGKGFYLESIMPDEHDLHVDQLWLSRFQWNGNGFSVVGEKTVRLSVRSK